MKRQMTLAAMTLVNSLRSARPSAWRKTIVVALSLMLVLVPLLAGRTFTPPVQAQICGTNANRIFQGCPLGDLSYEMSLESAALDDLLNVHQLPPSDRGRLMGWGRGNVISRIYARLLEVLRKAPSEQTPAEKAAIAAFADYVKARRVEAARFALEEYNKWKSDPCTYTPPNGFSYAGRQLCAARRINIGAEVDPPNFQEFQAYGVVRAFGKLQAPLVQRRMDETIKWAAFFGGGLGAGGITGLLVGFRVLPLIPVAAVKSIFPFAVRTTHGVLGGSTRVAAGLGAAFGAIGGAVLIVVTTIITATLRGIEITEISKIPGQLQETVNRMESAPAPDLAKMIETDSGRKDFFSNLTLMTLPDFPVNDAVPAAQDSDPKFRVRQDGAATDTTAATINFKSWDNDIQSARLNGGWLINKYKENNLDQERWALGIEYINWRNEKWTAARSGATFLHSTTNDPTQAFESAEIKYLDGNGNKVTASMIVPKLEIGVLPVVVTRHYKPTDGNPTPKTFNVARVNSESQALDTLGVSVNNGASATVTGVTISNLRIDATGLVTADLTAECGATNPTTFNLRVTDSAHSKTTPLTVRLSPVEYSFDESGNLLPSTLPHGEVGTPYEGILSPIAFFQYCTLNASFNFSVTSGQLPPGLSFGGVEPQKCTTKDGVTTCVFDLANSRWSLLGTPTSGGIYDFTIKVTFANGDSFSRDYTVKIDSKPTVLPDGALSWWSGERGIVDDLERNHGRLNNGFNSANFALGKVGLAFSFNGSFGSVQLPDNFFPFAPGGNAPFTFETWFKTASGGIIIGRQDTEPWGFLLPFNYSPGIYVGVDGRLRAQMFWNGEKNPVTSASAVNDNLFHHVAVIYDGTQQVVYLDGAEMGRAIYTQAGANVNYKYQLGTGYALGWPSAFPTPWPWFGFNGLIDEPTMYRRALTAQEVQSIYTAGSDGKIHINLITADPYCASDNSGVIKVNVLGGAPPFTYGLDHGATVGDFQPEGIFIGSAGDYTVKVKDAEERVFTRSVQLNNPTQSISATSQSFSAQSGTGSFNVTSSAGCGWQAVSDNPDFITITTPAGGQGSGSGAVNFSVAANNTSAGRTGVISIKSSIATHTFTVRQEGPPITATVSGGGMICPGGKAEVSVNLTNGVAPYTVTLTNGGGTIVSSSLPITFTVSPTVTTTYAVQSVSDALGYPANANGSATVTLDNIAPVITAPAPITVNGDSSGGATVTYSVTATDNSGAAPSLSFSKASGSFFPFGTTTVTATATDGCNSSQASFTVTVRTLQQQAARIDAQVRELVDAGTLTPELGAELSDKLNEVTAKLNQGQTGAACNQLKAFINQVNGFVNARRLTAAQGQALINAANALKTNIGCP